MTSRPAPATGSLPDDETANETGNHAPFLRESLRQPRWSGRPIIFLFLVEEQDRFAVGTGERLEFDHVDPTLARFGLRDE